MTVIWTQSPEELAQEKAQRRLDQLNGIPERDGPAAAEIGGGGRFGLRFARRSQDRALDRELEARKIDVLERQGDARLMNERSVAMTEALSGLRGGFGRPAVSSNLGGMSRITPQAPRASIAASIDEDLDEVDPMRPRAYKNGGVIGNVKKDDGSDKVPVVAREGEYYINPETVAHIGGGDYKQGLRSLNALVREATGKEPGPSPVGKSGLRGFNKGGFVDDFGDVTLGNKKLSFAAQQAVSEAATSPQGKRVIANQFAAPQAEAVAQAAKQARVQDISAQVREATGRRTPIDELLNPKARGVQAAETLAEPKAGLAQGAKNLGTKALKFLSSPGVVGLQLLTHSANAGDPNEDAWAARQREQWANRELKPGEEPWNNPVPYGADILKAPEKAPTTRGQGDEYTNSPERQAWLAEIAANGNTAPDALAAFRTRNAAADVYRREWQRQSPGGLRNANSQALDTYNAEQQTRGTGISAQRQANGVMEFSGSGPAPKAQYLDAGGNPTNEWQDTSQYRDAVVRSLGSSDPAMQQRGLAQAMQLQQRNPRGVSTGNPEMDQLLGQMDPREAAAVFRALNGGQGADGKGLKATPYGEQQKRVIDALGEEGAAKAMQEIQQAQMQMARQLIQSGQATPEQAEVAVQNPQFITRLTNAYKLREFLAQNGQWGEAASGAGGWGTAAGLAAGGLTLGLTRNPGVAARAAAAGGALGAGVGGAQGFTQGAQGFDAAMPLTGLMNITPLPNGDYQIGNAVIPKAMVQKNYQLFGLTAPPK